MVVPGDVPASDADRLELELKEARGQLAATSEILRVISASVDDAQPVFETIVRNARSLCGSLFANVFRFDGELLHFIASHNVDQAYVDLLKEKYPMRPDSTQVSGRVILSKSVVRLEDMLADPNYDQRFPPAMAWKTNARSSHASLREPIGVIVVAWAEPGPVSQTLVGLLKVGGPAVIGVENPRMFLTNCARGPTTWSGHMAWSSNRRPA